MRCYPIQKCHLTPCALPLPTTSCVYRSVSDALAGVPRPVPAGLSRVGGRAGRKGGGGSPQPPARPGLRAAGSPGSSRRRSAAADTCARYIKRRSSWRAAKGESGANALLADRWQLARSGGRGRDGLGDAVSHLPGFLFIFFINRFFFFFFFLLCLSLCNSGKNELSS